MAKLTMSILLLLLAVLPQAHASTLPWFELSPASITGEAGEDVGWGFIVHGYSGVSLWVYIVDVVVSHPSSPVGTFTPYAFGGGPTGNGIAPNTQWADYFNIPFTSPGLGTYSIDPGAPEGSLATGEFVMYYDEYDQDPETCGGCNPVNYGLEMGKEEDPLNPGLVFPSFEVHVSSVPEPTSLSTTVGGLMLIGIAAGLRWRRGAARPDTLRQK